MVQAAVLRYETSDEGALRSLFVGQFLATDSEAFKFLAAQEGGQRRMESKDADKLLDFMKRSVSGKSMVNNSLRPGNLAALGLKPGTKDLGELEQAAKMLARLNQEESFKTCADALKTCESAMEVMHKVLGVPRFRAHCMARFWWFHTCFRAKPVGTPPNSTFLGDGAVEAFNQLSGCSAKGMTEVPALAHCAQAWTTALEQAYPAIFQALQKANLLPTVQTWEHLLCEARKVFGSRNNKATKRKGGLAELWREAKTFFQEQEL